MDMLAIVELKNIPGRRIHPLGNQQFLVVIKPDGFEILPLQESQGVSIEKKNATDYAIPWRSLFPQCIFYYLGVALPPPLSPEL
jgi:hypothetical protein